MNFYSKYWNDYVNQAVNIETGCMNRSDKDDAMRDLVGDVLASDLSKSDKEYAVKKIESIYHSLSPYNY